MAEALSDIAYRLITKKLVASELVAGQKISEQTIASECGISRTPVREAIRRLTEEGLLYQIPSSGTYVASLDRYQLSDAYEVRMAIECFAIDRATRNLTKDNRQELRRLCDEMHAIIVRLRSRKQQVLDGPPLVAFLTADLTFHLLLLKAAGNRLAWVWRHHAKIERALRRSDAENARGWMRAHITRSLADALAAFDKAAAHVADAGRDPVDDALAQLTTRLA